MPARDGKPGHPVVESGIKTGCTNIFRKAMNGQGSGWWISRTGIDLGCVDEPVEVVEASHPVVKCKAGREREDPGTEDEESVQQK